MPIEGISDCFCKRCNKANIKKLLDSHPNFSKKWVGREAFIFYFLFIFYTKQASFKLSTVYLTLLYATSTRRATKTTENGGNDTFITCL